MKCQKCGQECQDGLRFCSNCGNDLWGQNQQNQGQGAPQYHGNGYPQQEDKTSVGLAILSFFIPIVGLILFLVKRDKSPKTSKACGICALVSFLVNLVVIGLSFALVFKATDTVFDNLGKFDVETNFDYEDDEYFYEDETDDESDKVVVDKKEEQGEKEETKEDTSKTDNGDSAANTSTEWKSYQFVVNGKTITLPCTYSELKSATGFSLKSADEKSYLEKGYYTTANMYKSDKLALYIELLNETDGDATYADCTVTSITQSEYQVEQGAAKITFPGGLQVGQALTVEQAKQMFGEPTDTYHYDGGSDYVSDKLTWSEDSDWTTHNNFEINILNGVIDELGFDRLYYNK